MKFFMPVYAVALTLAVTSNMVERASALDADTACVESTICPSGTTCGTGTSTAANFASTTVELTKASDANSGLKTCTGTAKAYVKSLQIVGANLAAAKLVEVKFSSTTAAASAAAAVVAADAKPACGNTFSDIGKTDPAADVKVSLKCTDECTYKYKLVYGCQEAAACATTTTLCPTADATACPAVTTTTTADAATSVAFTKPATGFTACADSKYAYLSKLTVFPDADTTASDIVVRISKDGTAVAADATAVTKDVYPTCSNTYSDLGKDATKDLKVTIGCAAAKACNFKYKAEWVCQAAPAASSGVAGTCTAAAWGTALVAAVAGANFAAPL